MAIGRVPGPALLSNLDRQGLDLQFTTNSDALVYMDFANFRMGVNTATPTDTLTVNGGISVAGNIIPSSDDQYSIGSLNNRFKSIYVGNLSVSGIETTGNVTADRVYANLIYENNNRVLTVQSNITITGDATGTGSNANVAVTLVDTGVVAGTYGAGDDEYADKIPKITVDSKGRITAISNVALTQIGNITFNDTTISSTSNITLSTVDQQIFVGSSRISNAADPEDPQDLVTLAYLDSQLDQDKRSISANNTSVSVTDNNISPGRVDVVVDGANIANITVALTELNSTLVNIGNLSISNNTLSSSGNIVINALGTGIVQIAGSDAIGIPAGDNSGRPLSPQLGYIRYNTDLSSIEYWNGSEWFSPDINTMTSQIITPNGVDNTYTLDEVASNETAIVIINGTVQQTQIAYQITGNSITFSEIPSTTDIIEVRTITTGAVTVQSLTYGNTAVVLSYGNVNTTGNIIPTTTETYDIGTDSLRWKDIYLSGNTIVLGNTRISTDGASLQFTAEGSETPVSCSGFSPASKWEEYNDLIINAEGAASSGAASTVIGGDFTTYASTAGSVTFTNGAVGHPGICNLTTSTGTATSVGVIKTPTPTASVAQIYIGGGELIYETLAELTALHDGTNTGYFRFGFMDEISGAPLNGIIAQCGTSADNWTLFCNNNGASTSSTGISLATTGWHHIKIVVNASGTSATLYVDGDLEATVASGLPSAGMSYGAQLQKTAGTTAISMNIDLFHVHQIFSTARY